MSRPVRVALPLVLSALIVGLALFGPACLRDPSPGDQDAAVQLDSGVGDALKSLDLRGANSGEDLAGLDLAKPILDFAATDLAGLVNCYGRAVCDPAMDFCISYNDGSEAAPGVTVFGSPACYTPDTPCADNGQAMDCGCIQNDAALGLGCQGSCIDNMDGTFVCYAQ